MSVGFSNLIVTPGSTTLSSKGDILSHDGTNPARVAVGSNGFALRANTSSSAGMYWSAAPVAGTTDYEPIAFSAITSDTASVDFSSIPGTYSSLLLVCGARTKGTSIQGSIKFNSSTSTSMYGWTLQRSDGGSLEAYNTKNASSFDIFFTANSTALANTFSYTSLQIHNYSNSSKYKTTFWRTQNINSAQGQGGAFGMGIFRNNDAITSINISRYNSSNDFVSGSTFALYGIK